MRQNNLLTKQVPEIDDDDDDDNSAADSDDDSDSLDEKEGDEVGKDGNL